MSSSVPELCVPDLSFHLRATELKAISILVIERIFAVRSILAIQKIFAVLIKTNKHMLPSLSDYVLLLF